MSKLATVSRNLPGGTDENLGTPFWRGNVSLLWCHWSRDVPTDADLVFDTRGTQQTKHSVGFTCTALCRAVPKPAHAPRTSKAVTTSTHHLSVSPRLRHGTLYSSPNLTTAQIKAAFLQMPYLTKICHLWIHVTTWEQCACRNNGHVYAWHWLMANVTQVWGITNFCICHLELAVTFPRLLYPWHVTCADSLYHSAYRGNGITMTRRTFGNHTRAGVFAK